MADAASAASVLRGSQPPVVVQTAVNPFCATFIGLAKAFAARPARGRTLGSAVADARRAVHLPLSASGYIQVTRLPNLAVAPLWTG